MNTELHHFADYLAHEKRAAQNTLQSYMRDLERFCGYLQSLGVTDWNSAASFHIGKYLAEMKNRGCSAATVSRHLAAIRAFYRFLLKENIVGTDPTLLVNHPKQAKRDPVCLDIADVDRLLAAPDPSHMFGLRDKAMLETLYATGMRVSELLALDVDSVNTRLGFVRCIGNHSRERVVPLGETAVYWLERYLTEGRKALLKSAAEHALFVNHLGRRLSRQWFWKLLKKYAADAGIAAEITPHTLRHSFAAHVLANGADPRTVQEMLGHAHLSSTQIYMRRGPEAGMKEVYQNTHPRAKKR
jgi:integrase/recombinase XerD